MRLGNFRCDERKFTPGFAAKPIESVRSRLAELLEPEHLLDVGLRRGEMNRHSPFVAVGQHSEESGRDVFDAPHVDANCPATVEPEELQQGGPQQDHIGIIPNLGRSQVQHGHPLLVMDADPFLFPSHGKSFRRRGFF